MIRTVFWAFECILCQSHVLQSNRVGIGHSLRLHFLLQPLASALAFFIGDEHSSEGRSCHCAAWVA